MGTTSIEQHISGHSLAEAYKVAVEEADAEYGHQEGYTGQLNSTSGIVDLTEDFKNSKLSKEDFIEKYMEKHGKHSPVGAICQRKPIGNKNVIKTQVEHFITPGTRKWVLKHVVYNDAGNKVAIGLTKGSAITKARAYTEKTKEETVIIMEKALSEGSPMVSRITYKPAKDERKGLWEIFGWANH